MVKVYMMKTCPYMHHVGINDYILKVLHRLDEIAFTFYFDVWSVKACGFMIGVLSTCEVMGLHMYIALVD